MSAPKVVVIPADREVKRIEAGKEFRAGVNGWFVPDARMIEIEAALQREMNK